MRSATDGHELCLKKQLSPSTLLEALEVLIARPDEVAEVDAADVALDRRAGAVQDGTGGAVQAEVDGFQDERDDVVHKGPQVDQETECRVQDDVTVGD